jgi:hypothetical protein
MCDKKLLKGSFKAFKDEKALHTIKNQEKNHIKITTLGGNNALRISLRLP